MTADAGALGMREELDMGDILVRSRTPRTISVTEPTDKSVTDSRTISVTDITDDLLSRTTTSPTLIETIAVVAMPVGRDEAVV